MADKGKQPSTRKQAHTIPLTHRQQRSKKRPQAEQAPTPSVAAARKRPATSARRVSPSSALAAADPAIETPAVKALAEAPAAEPALPAMESASEALAAITEEPATEAPEAQAEPRLVRVRVRRGSLPLSQILPPDITREDTVILPQPRIFPPHLTLALPTEAPLTETPLTDEPLAAPAFAAPAFAAPEEPPEPAAATPEALVAEEPESTHMTPDETEAAIEPEAVVAALTIAEESAVAEEPAAAEEIELEEQPERRRMPTLAVMAALAPRPEPIPTAPLPDLAEEPVEPDVVEPLGAANYDADFNADYHSAVVNETAPATAPLPADEPQSAPLAEESPAEVVVESPAKAEESDEAPAEVAAESPVEAEAPAEAPAEVATDVAESAEPAEPEMSAEPEAPSEAPAEAGATPAIRAWMWWARRRAAAPEARSSAAAEVAAPLADTPDQEAVNTAPRRTPRRQTAAVSSVEPTPAPVEDAQHGAARVVAGRADASVDALAERRRIAHLRQRYEAKHSRRAVTLSWVAFGHAAVASLAALIAVIAGLQATSGADAEGTLVWALALALIAGLGASFGYFCAQDGRPLLATLALTLSQLGALAWALALLGPRASLIALAPASVALALRGAGRMSAFATGCAWFLLYWISLALTLTNVTHPATTLGVVFGALVDSGLTLVGLWMIVNILISLYTSRMNAVARGRAVEHVSYQSEAQLARLRTQTEDDAEALRHALTEALRGEQPERVYARGALSAVGEVVNEMADRLVDLRYDRDERKRLESATRRLTRVIERAWLGLSWSWPEATGTILDDLLALMRTPPPPDAPDQLDVTSPTGQVVAPHLFRGWLPTEPRARVTQPGEAPDVAPGTPGLPSQPSAPSLPSLLEDDPNVRMTAPLELPPSPRWRGPDSRPQRSDSVPDERGATDW